MNKDYWLGFSLGISTAALEHVEEIDGQSGVYIMSYVHDIIID